MFNQKRDELKQSEVDWKWEKTKFGERLILTHIPSKKSVFSEEVRIARHELKSVIQEKKKRAYEDLFDKLEEVVYEGNKSGN